MMSEKIPMAVKSYEIPRKPLPRIMIRRPQPTRPWKLNQIDLENPQPNSIQPSRSRPVILDNRLIQSAKDQSNQESVNPSVQLPPKLRNKGEPSSEPIQDSPSSPNHQNDESSTDSLVYNIKIELEPEFDDTEEETSAYKTSEPAQANPNNRPLSVNDQSSRLQKLPVGKPGNDSQILVRQNPAAKSPSRVQSQEHLRPVTPFPKPQGNVNPEINHNHDISHVKMLMKSVLTPKFCSPNTIDLSAQRQIPAIRRKSSATITQPVEKKTRGNIESIPTQQMYQQLNYARNVQNLGHPYQNMNNSAAQNLSNLAHQAHPFDPSRLQFFRQYAQAHGIPISPQVPVNQRTYTRDPRAEYVQPLVQTQWLLNRNQIPAPRNVSTVQNQPARSLEALLTHDLPKHQNQRIEKVQVTEKEPDTLPGSLKDQKEILRKLQFAKLSVSSIKIDEFPPEITQNSVLETTNELEEMQSEVRSPEQNVKQSETEKLNNNQIIDVELIEDCGDEVTSKESGYETDRHPSKDLQAPVSEDEVIEVSTDDSCYAEDGICSEEDAPAITDEESMDAQSLVSESPENLSKESALKMLEAHGLMLTKLYRNFLKTEDYYNYLRMTTLGCLRLYRVMKKCVVEDDKESCPVPALKEKTLEAVEEPAEEPTEEPAEEPTEEPTEEPIEEPTEEPIKEPAPEPGPAVKKIPNGIQKKDSDSKIQNPKKDKKKQKLVLPPEYDPKDSKWTLRYKGPGRGLMELIPHSGVYLRRVEYNKCIKNADNCRKLARTLVKAVFHKNALGVCSVTGAKARAFNGTGMVTRPGLDEKARMVFLKFIEDFGKERDWDTSDTAGIISSIRTKMHGIRRKYEKSLEGQ